MNGTVEETGPQNAEGTSLQETEFHTEVRLLAGHLSQEELGVVYPPFIRWSSVLAERAVALCGAAGNLGPRPEAGRGTLFPVEEADALEILGQVTTQIPLGPEVPISYQWVEVANLISLRAFAEMTVGEPVDFSSSGGLAAFSLFGPEPILKASGDGTLIASSPLVLQFADLTIRGGRATVGYNMAKKFRAVIVGYEQGRLYLISGYLQVLRALAHGADRLLATVYYGMDFSRADLGLKLSFMGKTPLVHFGADRLQGEEAPLVRDYLKPAVSVVFRAPSKMNVTKFGAWGTEISLGEFSES